MFVSLCFLEGVATRRPISKKPPAELVTDSAYWLLSPYLRMVSKVMIAAILVLFALATGNDDGPSLVQGYGPLSRQPWPLILIETLILTDFCAYWEHRLMHRIPALWRFHAIHHSAKEIRWSTVGRVHPVNELINYVVGVLPCIAIGLPINAIIAIVPVMLWWAVLAHSNFKWTFGPLRQVVVSPIFHRWHHTHSQEGGDANFANVFSLWDRLFGSFYLPEGRTPQVFGLDVDDMPDTYLGQLGYPFGVTKRPNRAADAAAVLSSPPASGSST